jgi:TetR/AcrR family transcriptional repressor of nem operon
MGWIGAGGSDEVSREQVALNRERIVETAARLFREKGYDGIGVGRPDEERRAHARRLLRPFRLGEDLLAEAAAHALDKSVAPLAGYLADGRDTALQKIRDGYLTRQHCEHPEKAVPSALGADIARLGSQGPAC